MVRRLKITDSFLLVSSHFHCSLSLWFSRWIVFFNSLKYRAYVTERRQKIVVAICYLMGVLKLGVAILAKNTSYNICCYRRLIRYFLYHGNILINLSIALVYSFIFYQRRSCRQRPPIFSVSKNEEIPTENNNKPVISEAKQCATRRVVFVPFIIVLSFVVLVVVPCLVLVHSPLKRTIFFGSFLDHFWRFLWYVEFLTEVFVYTLMDKDIRNKLVKVIGFHHQASQSSQRSTSAPRCNLTIVRTRNSVAP